jgi:hypothetical protein
MEKRSGEARGKLARALAEEETGTKDAGQRNQGGGFGNGGDGEVVDARTLSSTTHVESKLDGLGVQEGGDR